MNFYDSDSDSDLENLLNPATLDQYLFFKQQETKEKKVKKEVDIIPKGAEIITLKKNSIHRK